MRIGFHFGNKIDDQPKRRYSFGIQTFIDETGAYTTIAAAVSILLVLVLLFASASTIWMLSRSEDIQTRADACALAGANVVSAYVECATIMDACVLSMSLTGLCVTGVGLIGLFIPGAQTVAERVCDLGMRLLEMRNEFALSAAQGLKGLEEALPYVIAMHSMKTVEAADTQQEYVGVAIAYPQSSDSHLGVDTCELKLDDLQQQSEEMKQIADELCDVQEKVAQAKQRAWIADCGRDGHNMQERADKLTSLSAAKNPDYETSIAWSPVIGLERTRAYYAWRLEHEQPLNSSVDEQIKSAARKVFYEYACDVYERATIVDNTDNCVIDIERLPRNTQQMKACSIYTDVVWPTTLEGGKCMLHFSLDCPGAKGAPVGLMSFAEQDRQNMTRCPVCGFDIKDLGAVPAASTSIDNGYEYHLAEYIEALDEYESLRQQEIDLGKCANARTDTLSTTFEKILETLTSQRPHIAPPGRYGCIAYVAGAQKQLPQRLVTSFSVDAEIGARGAVAAAVLAPDELSSTNNMLSSFVDRIQSEDSCVIDMVGDIFDLWGTLLVGYDDISTSLEEAFDTLTQGLNGLGGSAISTTLKEALSASLVVMGLEPVDLHLRKPVLTNSSHVLAASGYEGTVDVQQLVRSLPIGVHDPVVLAQAVGVNIEFYLGDTAITLAQIKIPGTSICIPIEIKILDVLRALS